MLIENTIWEHMLHTDDKHGSLTDNKRVATFTDSTPL